MYKVLVNDKEFQLVMDGAHTTMDGKEVNTDVLEFKKGNFHVIRNHRSYRAEIISTNAEEKTFVIRVNNHDYKVAVQDQYDLLLREMGMDASGDKKVNDIKAPMPGMVLNIMVENGQQIKKGEAIVILEAMKMENILKSPSDGTVKKVNITKGDKVEKNQVLISLG